VKPATEKPESEAEKAFRAYKSGNPEPVYQVFLAQARIAIWKNIRVADPTLCHQIAEKGVHGLSKFRGDSKVSTWFYRIAELEKKYSDWAQDLQKKN
jgi:hypothetical protein